MHSSAAVKGCGYFGYTYDKTLTHSKLLIQVDVCEI